MQHKGLSDILQNGQRDAMSRAWFETRTTTDFAPLPAGAYVAKIVAGELFTSKANKTSGYKLAFRVLEGEHTSRRFWHEVYLTPAALPMANRDLGKLGITTLEQMEKPLPLGIICCVKLALRRGDDATERNRVRSFDVIGINAPEADPFAPADASEASGNVPVPPRGEGDGHERF